MWKSQIPTEGKPSDNQMAPLYASRIKVHPKTIDGIYRKLKWAALVVLLGIYYIAPFLRWDRGPHAPDQALLIDMDARRAYFFNIEIWPQEVYYITGILIFCCFGLFLATALFGRVWCGFACPQTVWTDLFMWVERIVEGDRGARIRLDKAKMTPSKFAKRTVKHALWLLISVATGGAWILYFYDAPTFFSDLVAFEVPGNTLFFIGLFTTTTYLLAGFAREQVCTYMCPWPRFQGAMLDEDSMIVTYEAWRGEPRMKPAKDGNYEGRGHCIDCGQCIAVCPTGIDIREGNQLECIGCALCIDACNDIMEKIGLPGELITYDSVNRQNERARNEKVSKRKIFRVRSFVYVVLMAITAGGMAYALTTRSHLDMNVIPDRNPLYVTLKDGSIRNGYTVRILNKAMQPRDYVLELDGLASEGTLRVVGAEHAGNSAALNAPADSVVSYRVFVSAPRGRLTGDQTEFTFILTEYDNFVEGAQTNYDAFLQGPRSRD